MTKMNHEVVSGSFRDPSGFLFLKEGVLYRQINHFYKKDYDFLINSGLYKILTKKELLIPHEEVLSEDTVCSSEAYKVIKPEVIPFLSYPYEWCFSQLKDAALATLEIQKRAFTFGMSLKDASAYNIQFRDRKPILIDTLSFEIYREGCPWMAYRQFCQHFLAPLTLMSLKDIRLNQLSKSFIDGIPLDLTSTLLPFGSYFKKSSLSHIHLHAKSQKYFSNKATKAKNIKITSFALRGLIDSLESAIRGLSWKQDSSEWTHYYKDLSYSPVALQHKKQLVSEFLEIVKPKIVWDIGANTGLFSAIASEKGMKTISFDLDPLVVEKHYLYCKKNNVKNILPLQMDIANPSPAIGWENKERMSLLERGPADTVLALALIHHMAISNNVPMSKIARFFARLGDSLIVEFIPKNDSRVKKLLATREDIFPNYTQQVFEAVFRKYFIIVRADKIKDSTRVMYCMQKK